MPPGLSPSEIDAWVGAALACGEDLYHLDAGALAGLDADIVVTQDLCAVCAVDVSVVDDALAHLGCTARVVTIDPHTVAEVLESVTTLGEVSGHVTAAAALVAALQERIATVQAAVVGRARPRVLVLEWTDPPFAPGHWVPEMVELAGGTAVLGTAGEPSRRTTWQDAAGAAPDVIVCAPCGYRLDAACELAQDVATRFRGIPVWAVDANASWARPGPGLVDGIEALGAILHPGLLPDRPEHSRRIA